MYTLLTSSRIQDIMPLEASGYFYQQGYHWSFIFIFLSLCLRGYDIYFRSTLNMKADAGFKKRRRLFLTEGSLDAYSGEPATLCGPICELLLILSFIGFKRLIVTYAILIPKFTDHDLVSCEAGVPPGVSIEFNLFRNKPSIAIDCLDSPNAIDYKFIIKSAYLHCPIGRYYLISKTKVHLYMDSLNTKE